MASFQKDTDGTLMTSLVSYWKLDESSGDAADSVGSNTLTNANVTYTSGKINNCAVFNSSTDKLSIADASQTGLDLTGNLSISLWAYHNTDTNGILVSKNTGASTYAGYYFMWWSDNTLRFLGNNTAVDLASTAVSGAWKHLVVTRSGSTVHIYVNGSDQGSGSISTISDTAADFSIGMRAVDSGSPFDGNIDEVGIWSKTLSATEISDLYNGGSGDPLVVSSIKTIDGLAKASVKTVNGLAIASVKTFDGLA